MVFYLKKIFAVILDPVFLSVVVFFAGVIMLYAGKKKQRAGKLF